MDHDSNSSGHTIHKPDPCGGSSYSLQRSGSTVAAVEYLLHLLRMAGGIRFDNPVRLLLVKCLNKTRRVQLRQNAGVEK
jgi:hypothetical protein